MLSEQNSYATLIRMESLSDLIDSTTAVRRKFEYAPFHTSIRKDTISYSADFIGRKFNNWDDVCVAAQTVWPEGMRTYENMMNQLRDEHIVPPRSLKRQAVWSDEEGDEVDLDRIRSGQPYLRTTRRQHRPGPLSVTIISNITASANKASQDIMWRGAASICLTELLERAGYRVELWCAARISGTYPRSKTNGAVAILCKRGTDPLDCSSLVNIMSGWGFRTLFFASLWVPDETPDAGYGYAMNIKGIEQEITQDEQAIICENVWNHSAAVTWVREQIGKLK